VNVIFQKFQAVNYLQHSVSAFLTVPERFMIVSELNGTLNGQKHLGVIKPGRNNALERIVENYHGTFTL
jgi:hypothetical protein